MSFFDEWLRKAYYFTSLTTQNVNSCIARGGSSYNLFEKNNEIVIDSTHLNFFPALQSVISFLLSKQFNFLVHQSTFYHQLPPSRSKLNKLLSINYVLQ